MDLERVMRERSAELEGKRSDKFALNCCKKLCQQLGVHVGQDAYESAFSWFHEAYPRFPVYLEARDIKCNVNDMFARMTKTKVWEAFFALAEEIDKPSVGLLVMSKGNGLFVFHNDWRLGSEPGFSKIIRRAKTAERGVIFESLESFTESVKSTGWSP